MKVCFDTSVLVAALVVHHPRHPVAFERLAAVHTGNLQGYVTTHGLAEVYATLTALPLKPRLSPSDALRLIDHSVMGRYKVVPLGARHYSDALALTVRQGLASGAIYDALHLIGARTAGCERLLTFNIRHFSPLSPDDPLVSEP